MAKNAYITRIQPYLDLITAWKRDGCTDAEIAKKLGVSESSFFKHKAEQLDFKNALLHGQQDFLYKVENSLYKNALGYDYEEKTYVNGELKKVVKKHHPGETGAQCVVLFNLWPEKYKDVKKLDLSGELSVNTLADLARKYHEKQN